MTREQQRASDTLTELKINHKMEVNPFEEGDVNFSSGNLLNVDIVYTTKKQKQKQKQKGIKRVAMEFYGPREYVRCEGVDVENGLMKFKRRLLEGLGFTVSFIRRRKIKLKMGKGRTREDARA